MFLIQGGHQQHSRVGPAISGGLASGVIWSPGDMTPDGLAASASELRNGVQAVDSQLYVAPLQDANPKKLPQHELFDVPLGPRDFSGRHLVSLVERVLGWQHDLPVTHLLSPTVALESMNSRWAQIAADLADTSLEHTRAQGEGRPLLISVAAERSLLADPDNVDALLDELTALEAHGFYLLFEIDPNLDPAQAAVLYERALYIVHTLARLNEYTVWVGYAGLAGYVFRAVGAEAFGAGWFRKQQWWSPSHWTGAGGGRQPRPRVFLDSVVGSLILETELGPVARQRSDSVLLADVIASAGDLAESIGAGRSVTDDFTRDELNAQLFAVCNELDGRISGDVGRDLSRVLDDIAAAQQLHRRIRDVDIELDARGGENLLAVWQTAVRGLAGTLGIPV